MNISGRLWNPEFLGSSIPLTAMIRGKKVTVGMATIDYSGRVNATVENAEVQELISKGLNSRLSIRLNPEVRVERTPALQLENIIVASSDLVSE